ncbi:response regulator transcription factor [Vallitalea maricola]|uniref:Response regulator transcription factor n=1 Tax=Vallitalea maricola TaxID=3074433 RepID=A0ACB5URU4_9FIRM|nr:response regulator transcription factor [Vallitalea sp. AN17-2]
MAYKILIIEDEKKIRDIVGKYLINEDYEVFLAKDGFEGLSIFHDYQPNLIILDVMMPGISGFEVLKEIRLISELPVIMLTAKQEEVDRLKGFNLGADDYVPKPFSPRELVKRVQVILKRSYHKLEEKEILVVGPLQLDTKQHKLVKKGKEIEITTKEYLLLNVFFSNIGRLLTREQLIMKAFGYDYDGFDRNIDSYIKKIRQKIENDTRNPQFLKTKYGAGYVFGGGKIDH